MTIIPYLRVSTLRQAQEGQSLAAQEARIRSWASQNGHTVGQLFSDEGLSGGRADNRPELQKAIQTACEQQAALVVVSLSRLARSTTDAIQIVGQLEAAGAQFISLSEQLDTTTAAGKMIFRVMAVLAEFERELISERTRSVLDHKRQLGQRISRIIPYGYTLHANGIDLVANPEEQQVISDMKDWRRQGLTFAKIAKAATELGIKTKTGKDVWQPCAVQKIIEKA